MFPKETLGNEIGGFLSSHYGVVQLKASCFAKPVLEMMSFGVISNLFKLNFTSSILALAFEFCVSFRGSIDFERQ